MTDEEEQRIRERAYSIWEQEGRPQGRELDHRLRAEAEIAAETSVVETRHINTEITRLIAIVSPARAKQPRHSLRQTNKPSSNQNEKAWRRRVDQRASPAFYRFLPTAPVHHEECERPTSRNNSSGRVKGLAGAT